MKKPKLDWSFLPASIKHYVLNNGRTHRIILTRKWTKGERAWKNFDDPQAAADWARQQIEGGKEANLKLTPDELADARKAITALKECPDKSLLDVVNYYIQRGPGIRKPLLLSGAFELYAAHLRESRKAAAIPVKLIKIRVICRELGDRFLHEYTTAELKKWLEDMKAATKWKDGRRKKPWGDKNQQDYYTELNLLFRYCVSANLMGENPLESHELQYMRTLMQNRKPLIQIYTVPECWALLETALLNPGLDLTGFISVGMFCGARVSEIKKLRWSDVLWKKNEINIPSDVVAKGGDPRRVIMPPVLRAWLERTEKVNAFNLHNNLFFDPTNYRSRMEKLFELTGDYDVDDPTLTEQDKVGKRPRVVRKRNAWRHVFCSYFYAKTNDAILTRLQIGHKCQAYLFKYYSNTLCVDEEKAEEFFNLFPTPAPKPSNEILEFAANPTKQSKYNPHSKYIPLSKMLPGGQSAPPEGGIEGFKVHHL